MISLVMRQSRRFPEYQVITSLPDGLEIALEALKKKEHTPLWIYVLSSFINNKSLDYSWPSFEDVTLGRLNEAP